MLWRYIVNNSGSVQYSEEIELDETYPPTLCMTIMQGFMFQDSWSPNTPYLIERFVDNRWAIIYASWNWRDEDDQE